MKKLLSLLTFSIAILFTAVSATYAQDSSNSVSQVTMIEYSDYQCPACGYFFPIVEKLKEDFGNSLKIEYRYFPLNGHQYGALAARAAQAAKNQGKFKAMHDKLFRNQQSWSSSGNPQSVFIGYAEELGLDVEQFKEDLNSAETQKTVMEEKKKGQEIGVNSTPTFIVNGDMLEQLPRTYQDFKSIIESHM